VLGGGAPPPPSSHVLARAPASLELSRLAHSRQLYWVPGPTLAQPGQSQALLPGSWQDESKQRGFWQLAIGLRQDMVPESTHLRM